MGLYHTGDCSRVLTNMQAITFPIFSLDVVRAYRNLLQEKEALEASVKVLTTSNNQPTKPSHKKETTSSKDQKESVKDKRSGENASKSDTITSPLEEDGVKKEEVLDHPLAIKDDEVNNGNHVQHDQVWCCVDSRFLSFLRPIYTGDFCHSNSMHSMQFLLRQSCNQLQFHCNFSAICLHVQF